MTDHSMLCESPFGHTAHQYKSLFKIGGKATNQTYSGKKQGGKKLRAQCCNRDVRNWKLYINNSYLMYILELAQKVSALKCECSEFISHRETTINCFR